MVTRIKSTPATLAASGDYVVLDGGTVQSQTKGDWTTNVSLIALGISEVREGSAIVEGGLARLAEGICEAWNSSVRWSYGSGDSEESGVCVMRDMFKGRRNEKGEADSRFMPAMYKAIGEAYGVDGEFSGADKMAYSRAFGIAAARMAGAPVEFVDATVKRKGKDVKVRAVRVPASVAFKVTDDDGKPSALGKELIERIKSNLEFENKPVPEDAELLTRAGAMPVNCVGGSHKVLGKLPSSTSIATVLRSEAVKAGSMPAPKPRNTDTDKGASFINALAHVVKCLDSLGGDEPEVAIANEGERLMREVAERIAAYFVN